MSFLTSHAGRAIACGECKDFRRLDRSAKRGAERPCFNDKQLIGDRRSLRAAHRALVETTEIATFDSPACVRGRKKRKPASDDKIPRIGNTPAHESLPPFHRRNH